MSTAEHFHIKSISGNADEIEFVSKAKEHLRDYVESVSIQVPRFGPNAYNCPCCGSGTGKNHTPAFFLFRTAPKLGNELHFKCHSCGVTGDIFTLAGLLNNTKSFAEQKRFVRKFLETHELGPAKDTKVHSGLSEKEITQLRRSITKYISECENHINETDYFQKRGLLPEIIKKFHLGYDPKRQMAIIPFTRSYYIGRSTQVAVDGKGTGKHYKPPYLPQPLYNTRALGAPAGTPVFITEAPLDAISILQSGGRCMALGGLSTNLFEKAIRIYRPEATFILCLDNDERGQKATEHLSKVLKEYGCKFRIVSDPIFKKYKDPNAALMADPIGLRIAVSKEKELAIKKYNSKTAEQPRLEYLVNNASNRAEKQQSNVNQTDLSR